MIEFGATPINVNVWPCKLAPCAFITIKAGSVLGASGFAVVGLPIVFSDGAEGAFWAKEICGTHKKPATATMMEAV
jgi:hypothetical protein